MTVPASIAGLPAWNEHADADSDSSGSTDASLHT